MFEPGMGGTFLANLFNIADPGLNKLAIEQGGRNSMFQPVGGYDEEEYTPMFHSGKFLFRGIHELSFDHDIDLMLSDIEVRTLYDLEYPADDGNSPRYFSHATPTTSQKSLYLPMHCPKCRYPEIALNRVANYAGAHGITVRFLLCTTDSESARFWVHRRSIRLGIIPEQDHERFVEHYENVYKRALLFRGVSEFNLDRYFAGDVDDLMMRISNVVQNMENQDVVRSRAVDFWKNKMYHVETSL